MLALCKPESDLLVANRVFRLLVQVLGDSESPLAALLLKYLKEEILKRRTILSTVLQVLDDPEYSFEMEAKIGQRKPTKKEILNILIEILRATEAESASQYCEKSPVSCTSLVLSRHIRRVRNNFSIHSHSSGPPSPGIISSSRRKLRQARSRGMLRQGPKIYGKSSPCMRPAGVRVVYSTSAKKFCKPFLRRRSNRNRISARLITYALKGLPG